MDWFTGFSAYHTVLHCMGGDRPWALALTTLCGAVFVGYLVIARTWLVASRAAPDGENKALLRALVAIFVFCGFCGYVSRVAAWWWPGYRLMVFLLAILVAVTWWFAIKSFGRAHIMFNTLSQNEESEAIRAVWDSSAVGMALVTRRGEVARVNETLAGWLGHAEGALAGKTLAEVMHPEDSGDDLEALAELWAGKRSGFVSRKRLLRADGGELHGIVTVGLVRSEASYAAIQVVNATDLQETKREMAALRARMEVNTNQLEVTERHLRDAEALAEDRSAKLKEARQRLESAQRLEAVGRLAGGVAHDFRNMLSVILGSSELALLEAEPGTKMRRRLELIHEAGEKSALVVGQLLAFGRKQLLSPQVLNVNTVLEASRDLVRRMIPTHTELTFELPEGLRKVEVDPGQLEQALINLCLNASEAMPEGGKITVRARNVEVAADQVELPDAAPGRYVVVEVEDDGEGMSEATLARVFEPFFTTKGVGKGTGMGLASVHGFVKQSGGSVQARSVSGAGAVFSIYLPEYVEAFEPAPEVAGKEQRSVSGTERVLVVEDEPVVRGLMVQALEAHGYEVLSAGDGLEALELLERLDDVVELVVTDVVMPRMGGRELVQRLPSIGRDELMVIFVTGYAEPDEQGSFEGRDLLTKPVTPSALLDRVREALDRNREQTPSDDAD